jgi:hypothetical protein
MTNQPENFLLYKTDDATCKDISQVQENGTDND